MKALITKIVMLLLVLTMSLALFACNGNDTPNTPETPDNGGEGNTPGEGDTPDTPSGGNTDGDIDWNNTGLDGLALIYNNKARFQVVYTAESGAMALEIANTFVARLRELKIEVADPVPDTDASKVAECEIIIGLNAQNRGEELSIQYRALGNDGFAIKTVGTKIVIAGGSDTRLDNTYRSYLKDQMGITNKTKKLTELAVSTDYSVFTPTKHSIEFVKVGGNDLAGYTIFIDVSGSQGYSTENVDAFRDQLFEFTGYWLEIGNNDNIASTDKKIVIKCNGTIAPEYEEYGFAAYVDETKSLIIECTYANAFDKHFKAFSDSQLLGKISGVSFGSDYEYTSYASRIYYSDFGADGKGVINDYQAIYDTHVYANQCGQTVMGDTGATYYVGPAIPVSVPVKTNVDWNGCTFLVDDTTSAAYQTRSNALFTMTRDYPIVELNEKQIDEIAGTNATLNFGDTSVPWLADYIETKSLVMFTNAHHKDFVRHGANQSSGENRKDVFIMYPDGSIDPETEVCFEFDDFTLIQIHRVDDTPVTIKNGNFINICCRTVLETNFIVKYHAYSRGVRFERSNVTMQNVTHSMQDEPELDFENGMGDYGGCNESYPYYAFIYTERTYNLLVKDCTITGHTTYYEDKPATESTGGVKPAPVAAGSYDMAIERSINVHFLNTHQTAPTGLGDTRYWGIMTSNWTKDMTFENCSINRFDAHRSFWGARLINTDIGHTINLVGGGELYMENVRKMTGPTFIDTRSDYGGTFRGNITLIDCTLDGVTKYRSNTGGVYDATKKETTGYVVKVGFKNNNETGYWNWDFGFPSYMPTNVTLDNFTSGINGNTYVFPDFADDVFTTIKHKLTKTECVTFINMDPLKVCPTSTLYEMNTIKVVVKKNEAN